MKQISARQFRTSFPALIEPVAVLRRNKNGDFTVLGTWTPTLTAAIEGELSDPFGRALLDRFGTSHPAPKPKR